VEPVHPSRPPARVRLDQSGPGDAPAPAVHRPTGATCPPQPNWTCTSGS